MAGTGEPKVMQLAEIFLVEDNPIDVQLAMKALGDVKMRNNVHVGADGITAERY